MSGAHAAAGRVAANKFLGQPMTSTNTPIPEANPSAAELTGTERLAANLIAGALANGLTHPGNAEIKPVGIPLPMFRTIGMPESLAKQVRKTTQIISEAIVYLVRNEGKIALVRDADITALVEAPRPNDAAGPTVVIACPHGRPILEVVARPRIRLAPGQLAVLAGAAECRHP